MEEQSIDYASEFAKRITALTDKYKERKGVLIRDQAKTVSTNISNYRNGVSTPTAAILARICDFYGVSADWLLGLSDDPRPHGRRA